MHHFISSSRAPSSRFIALCLFASLTLPLIAGEPPRDQVIYATSFERPTYVAGSTLVGTDEWTAPPPLSPDAAVIVLDHATAGRQSVQVNGSDLVFDQDDIATPTNGYYTAIGSYRRPINYDASGKQIVRVSADVRIDGPKTDKGNNFFSASVSTRGLLDNGDNAGVGELALSSDGHVYGYTGNDLVPTFLTSEKASLGQWHNLAIDIDFARQTFSFLIDGECLGSFPFDPNGGDGAGVNYTTTLVRGSILAYAGTDTKKDKKQNYSAHYDQFEVSVIHNDDDDHGHDGR